MALELFTHNQEAYAKAVELLDKYGKAAVIQPTGSGKSFVAFKLAEDNRDKRFLWLAPSEYIFDIQVSNLIKASPDSRVDNITFMTYSKLLIAERSKLADEAFEYIILDEFHRCGARKWGLSVKVLMELCSDAKVLGLSATHVRFLDEHRNMAEELFDDHIASMISLGEAIVKGILNAPKYIRAIYSYDEDIRKYHKWVNDIKSDKYKAKALNYIERLRRSLGRSNNLECVFEKHMGNASGKYIIFCANIRHMREMVSCAEKWFGGINPFMNIYQVNCRESKAKEKLNRFNEASGKSLKLLFCVNMLNEGIHVNDVDGVILFRPTVSPIIYKQQIGRALSTASDKCPLIIDVVNNYSNLKSISSVQEEMKDAKTRLREEGRSDFIVAESFEIIDESEEPRVLFEKIEAVLDSTWESYFEKAKDYYEINGDLDIPQKYRTEDNMALGIWISVQRRVREGKRHGQLTEERITRLDSIGMLWGKANDRRWEKNYRIAESFYRKYGHLKVLMSYVDPDHGVHLGQWITYQRSKRKRGELTESQIIRLDEIGMIWDVKEHIHRQFFSAAVAYAEEHGDCNAPQDYVTEDGVKLGIWLCTQRARYRDESLEEEEINALNKLHMNWGYSSKDKWKVGMDHLISFIKAGGDINIKDKIIMEDGFDLSNWLRLQKRYYTEGILSDDRKICLEEFGVAFGKTVEWDDMYEKAKQYYIKYGHLNICRENGIRTENGLGRWIGTQRRSKSKLSEDKIRKLNDIGMDWRSYPNRLWEEKYEKVKEYHVKYGDINNIPFHLNNKYGFNMASWIDKQRKKYSEGEMKKERVVLLESVGMQWV